jgi:dihydroxyacid dehydratase/phosphogluconate dehydratase
MMVAHEADKNIDIASSDDSLKENVQDVYGDEGKNPGDFLFLFEKPLECMTEDEKVKKATFTAYNEVGKTAHLEGNVNKAKAIMKYLGYSDEEFQIAGKDSYNYQGVGNPH